MILTLERRYNNEMITDEEKKARLQTASARIAHCCLNCEHRKGRIEKNVICSRHDCWVSERVICDFYVPTTNEHISRAEKLYHN